MRDRGRLPLRWPGWAGVLLIPSLVALALPFVAAAFSVGLVALVAVLVAVLVVGVPLFLLGGLREGIV